MQESYIQAFCAFSRHMINKLYSLFFCMIECLSQIIYCKGNMMYPLTSFFNESGNRAVRFYRLKKFNFRITDQEKSCFDLLVSHKFNVIAIQTKNFFIEPYRAFKVFDSNPNMFNM